MLENLFKGLFDTDFTNVISVKNFLLCMGVSLVIGIVLLLDSWIMLLENALASRAGLPATSALERELGTQRSSQELMSGLRSLKKARELTLGNVSPGAVCGWLQWELR